MVFRRAAFCGAPENLKRRKYSENYHSLRTVRFI